MPAENWAVVLRVLTWSFMRPVSRTVRLSTGDLAGALGMFGMDADTSPVGSVEATPRFVSVCVCVFVVVFSPVRVVALARLCGVHAGSGGPGSCVCVVALAYLGGVLAVLGGPASRRRSGALHGSCCSFGFVSAASGLCVPLLCFFSFFSPFTCAPLVSVFPLFQALIALGLGAFWLPCAPSLFFFFLRPPCLRFSVVSGPGWLEPRRFVAARPIFLFLFAPPLFAVYCPWVPLALAPFGLVSFFTLGSRPFVWCVSCALVVCPPPPWAAAPGVVRCPTSCCVVPRSGLGCFVWFVVFFCAVLCWCA